MQAPTAADQTRDDDGPFECGDRFLYRIVLGARGFGIAAPVLRAIRALLSDAVIVITDDRVVIHAATDKGIVYTALGWQLFEDYQMGAGAIRGMGIYFTNSMRPRPGTLFDFVCAPAKHAQKDPFISATITVEKGSECDRRFVLRLAIKTESGESTRVKYSTIPDTPVYLPIPESATRIGLEPYAHSEITKWLATVPGEKIRVCLADSSLRLRVACESDDLDRECPGLDFNTRWFDEPASSVSSAAILARLAGSDNNSKVLSKRAADKRLKENRLLAVCGRKECAVSVTVPSGAAMKAALTWLKVGMWGAPSIAFYSDEMPGMAVELSGRSNDPMSASILFFSDNGCGPAEEDDEDDGDEGGENESDADHPEDDSVEEPACRDDELGGVLPESLECDSQFLIPPSRKDAPSRPSPGACFRGGNKTTTCNRKSHDEPIRKKPRMDGGE